VEKYPLRTTYFSAPLLCSRHEKRWTRGCTDRGSDRGRYGLIPAVLPAAAHDPDQRARAARSAGQTRSSNTVRTAAEPTGAPNSSPTTDDLSRTGSLTGSDGLAGKTASVTRALAILWGETGLSSCQLTRRSL
jgi:hypothetical protein